MHQEDKEKYKRQTGTKDKRQITRTLFKKNGSDPYSQSVYSHLINNPNKLTQTPSDL